MHDKIRMPCLKCLLPEGNGYRNISVFIVKQQSPGHKHILLFIYFVHASLIS